MAMVILHGKHFEIDDADAERIERNYEEAKKSAIERKAKSHLHGKMVFTAINEHNSDIRGRGKGEFEYGPIYIIHRAVIAEDRSVLWMPNFRVRLENICSLENIYPVIDKLILEHN